MEKEEGKQENGVKEMKESRWCGWRGSKRSGGSVLLDYAEKSK